ncbi:MAG: hypothetical protein P1P64_04150 [Treponemataceae bacterium]
MSHTKKVIWLTCSFLLFTMKAFTHTPLLIIEDTDEEYVYVKAGFSNGQDAVGMSLLVKSKHDDRVIETHKFPKSSELKVKIPDEPYYLVFDGGPGHKVAKNGPAPEKGFTVHQEAASNKIPGKGIPLVVIIVLIAVAVCGLVFGVHKLLKKNEK